MNEHGFESNFEFGELKISGQSEYGYRPFQLMISSIAGCSGGVLRNILKKMRLPYEDITIEAEVTRNEEIANRIEKIHLIYTIKAEDISQKKAEKANVKRKYQTKHTDKVSEDIFGEKVGGKHNRR